MKLVLPGNVTIKIACAGIRTEKVDPEHTRALAEAREHRFQKDRVRPPLSPHDTDWQFVATTPVCR